ncbi:hypothetical protein D9758_001807 [Tetrapyrgos nigripes]|uniref:Uncharacterized protein n=1 Tax=Tetrapyrgos nigripes TaxID=182062 RepID=A0A8H5LV69_9AGAR|nr:hypothetical protein D9758_001807 [Tetrapyrgos nigripes]
MVYGCVGQEEFHHYCKLRLNAHVHDEPLSEATLSQLISQRGPCPRDHHRPLDFLTAEIQQAIRLFDKIFIMRASLDHCNYKVDFKMLEIKHMLLQQYDDETLDVKAYYKWFIDTTMEHSDLVGSLFPMTETSPRVFVWESSHEARAFPSPFANSTVAYLNSMDNYDFAHDFQNRIAGLYYVPTSSRNPLFNAFFSQLSYTGTLTIWVVCI